MFKKYNDITICVNKEYTIDVESFIYRHVKVKGAIDVYVNDNKSYTGFKTKFTAKELSKLIEKKLYKSKTNIIGGVIFVEMYLK